MIKLADSTGIILLRGLAAALHDGTPQSEIARNGLLSFLSTPSDDDFVHLRLTAKVAKKGNPRTQRAMHIVNRIEELKRRPVDTAMCERLVANLKGWTFTRVNKRRGVYYLLEGAGTHKTIKHGAALSLETLYVLIGNEFSRTAAAIKKTYLKNRTSFSS